MSNERVTVQVDAIGNFSGVIGEVNKLQSRLQGLKLPSNLNSKFEGSLKNIMDKYNQFQTLASKGIKTKGDFSKLNNSAKEVEASVRELKRELNGITEQKLKVQVANLPEVKALEKEIERLKKTYSELNNLGTNKIQGVFGEEQTNSIRKLVGESKNLKPALENAFKAIKTGNISEGLKELDKFESALHRINGGALTNFQKGNPNRKSEIQAYISAARQELMQMDSGVAETQARLNQLKTDKFNQMASGISAAKVQLDNLGNSAARSTREILNTARATQNMETQLSGLQTQANYFFGLQNMIQLFRRGLSDTIQTVRDLDKAMTDTAVVTDMTVGDLWAQLPDYTKLANKLGATTQGAYETMTLYYQQGLNKQETFEIGEETMKMARIAGLDYAQTTNMMTAALRGFNMELNQTSAKRVNDVYSELAAITASDTRELGLAMERTASIAHSANMDFGNTTAFLAQMIETTREAPENLGTAMKTIIARFQELKANPYEISEVEGEEVDFNRVDKALKSIGVDLMDNRDKFRDLDDVFMDISSKWDGLSQTQQRYVATMAAGSRQQSRFLAMVQNYDRLKELTDAAANSEGASEVQFSKTLDSMEAKLNKLNNAWDQFAMGITNSNLIKKGTGFLVKMLDTINKFETGIEHMGDRIGGVFGDIFKSITSFTGLLLGFKGLGKLTDIGIGMLGGMLGMGKGVKTGMFGGMSGMRQATNMAQAKAISSPIVAAINKLTAVMTKGKVTSDTKDIYSKGVGRQEFKNRHQQLRGLAVDESYSELAGNIKTAKSFNIGQFKGAFKDLNREEQAALYRGQKGTRDAIQRSFEDGIKNLKVSDSAQKAASTFYSDLDYAMANGSQHVENGLTKAFDPVRVGKAIGGDTGEEIYKAALEKRKNIIRQGAALGMRGKDLENFWRTQEANIYGQNIKLNGDEVGKLTSRMNGFTSAINGAGASLMQLGMTMQSLGFEKLGGAISTAGSALMSFGMMADTIGHSLDALKTKAPQAFGALKAAGPMAIAAMAAFGLAFAAFKIEEKKTKDIRKSGKEVINAYEDTTKSVQENLNKLDKYKADWGKWTSGVDVNGNNINLGSEEYQDYKKAVKDITQMQPELIKGYNAEGEAIIDNNTALSEAIRLENQRKKTATEDYLKNGQKIIDRRNSTERWKNAQRQKIGASDYSQGAGSFSYEKSTIEKDAQKVADAIKKVDGGEELLKKWNITFDTMGNITQDSINTIRDYGGDIQNELVKSFNGKEITDAQQKLLNGSQDAIAQLGKDFKGVEKVSQETFDALKVHATDKGFYDSIDSDLIAPFQKAIGRIAEEDLSWDEAQNKVNDLGKKYQQLGGHMQDYHDIQDKVADAQKEFGKDLDTDAYRETVEGLTEPMDEWIEELENSTDQADQILAEWITQQKNRFLDLSKSLPTLEEGFNTLTGEIASANSAYDNWSKRNEEKGDYYTASEGFKKMYDEVNDGVDDLGKKSQSWWSAAESMMGEDYVMKHGNEAVAEHMKEVGRYFEEGKQGVDNFLLDIADKFQDNTLADGTKVSDYITANAEGGLDWNIDDVSDEKFEQLAAAIGLSTDAFTALVNKARQFYDIDFSNVEDMRAAIAAGETAMVGKGTTNGQQNLYMRESEFQAQARAAGGDPEKIRAAEKDLIDAGVIFTKDVKSLIKDGNLSNYFKDWGLAGKNGQVNTHDFIAGLDRMQYNKDEISELYKNSKGLISDEDKTSFEEAYNAYKAAQDPTNNSVFSIQGTTEGILSAVNSIALSMGILTKEGSQEIDSAVKEAEKFDNNAVNYDNYKDYENQRSELESSLTATLDQLEAAKDQATNDADRQKIQDKIEQVSNTLEAIKSAELSKTEFNETKATAAEEAVTTAGGKTSQYYKDTAINDKNTLDIDKLNNLIGSVQKNVEGKNEQNNVIGQYLQNSTKTLIDNGASNKEIASSIQTAAQQMADKGMTASEIAAAINQGYGTHLKEKDVTTGENGKIAVDLDQSKLQEQLANIHAQIDAQVNITGFSAKSIGQNNPNSAFHRTGTMARGSRKGYTIPGRPTLMGEEGEEVVWEPKRNEAYIVGSNGPQFGNISKNAVVWNAQQTKRIKKNSKTTGILGTGAKGITPIGTMKGGNAGGGGGMKIPGIFDIDATANIQDIKEPIEKPEIPVKAKLEVDGSTSGGLFNKVKGLFGKGEGGPTVKVTAEATKVNIKEQAEAVKLTGDIIKLNNKADNVKGIEATATVTKVTKGGQVAGEPVKVQATATTTPKVAAQPKKQVSAGTQTMTVTANTAPAMAKIRALTNLFNKTYTLKYKASGPNHIKVPISANFTGQWSKTVTINKSGASGQNNYIAHRIAPSFGSAAKGRGGRLGPKNRGGLTLTGEKGYEIAWLPSENRSMILGAQGPQMLKLPNDAVIWNHEQSKEILKKKQTISAGSMGNSVGGTTNGFRNGSSTTKTIVSTAKTVKKNSDKSAKAVTDAAKAAGYVSVWWENIARKTEVTQRKMDTSAKAFEKYLKEMSATLKKTGQSLASGGGGGNDYISNIIKFMSYNQAQINKATAELKQLDKGTTAQQKGKKNANKAAYNSGAASAVQISYSYKTGKKKKKSKTKNEIVNTAGYIKAENGTYVIDQAKLNQVKNVEKRKALKEALDKEINDRLSKKYAAEDNIQKAQEALEKMGEELYKTFFAWETELTKIWNLTKLIESSEGRVSRAKEYQETLNKQLSTGLQKATDSFKTKDLNAFQAKITQTKDKINNQVDLINKQKEAVTNAINVSDEQTILNSINKKLQDATAANNKVSNAKDKYDKALAKANNLKSQKSKAQQDIKNANKEIAELKKQKKKAKSSKKKKQIQKQIDAAEKKKAKAEGVLKTIDPKIKNAQKEADAAKKAYEQIKKSTSGQLSATEKLGYENYAKNLQDKIDAQLAAQKYLTISRSADGTLQVKFDTDKFEKDKQAGLLNEERGKAIQDYVKELVETSEELNKAYQDLNATINELYDDLSQLQDDWTGYANDLWDISEKEVKSQTDNFKKLSDSINNALKKLLDEVKNKLDERRKQEDNAKTERDIAQKQQRLAALRADTSGGHQVEIAQLEKEIADAQQDYQRNLEDQLLDRLQQQADLASQQREHQIALQEAILDGVNNAALVNKWMDNPAAYRNEIYEAYKTANEYDKRPDVLKEDLDRKFEVLMEGLLTNQEKQRELIEAINETKQASDIIENSINDMSNAETVKPATVSTSSSSSSSTTPSSTTTSTAKTPQKSTVTKSNNSKQTAYTNYLKSVKKLKPGSVKSSHINKLFTLGAAAGKGKATVLIDLLTKVGGSDPFNWKNIFRAIIDADGIDRYNLVKTWPNGTGTLADALKTLKTNPNTLKEIKKHKNYKNAKALKFKTGGLADYTGPAWLDGTPSKPELVLDATDTKNFLALKDVLSKAIHNSNSVSNSYGDAAYEININVDHLNSDYDVDRVAERVKKIIVKDAGYRNVTQVRNFR